MLNVKARKYNTWLSSIPFIWLIRFSMAISLFLKFSCCSIAFLSKNNPLLIFLDHRGRVSEPEAGRLRNPETPCRYIIAQVNESIYFFITLGTLLKSLFTNILYFELWEPQSREPSQNRRLRNPTQRYTNAFL